MSCRSKYHVKNFAEKIKAPFHKGLQFIVRWISIVGHWQILYSRKVVVNRHPLDSLYEMEPCFETNHLSNHNVILNKCNEKSQNC